MYLDDPSRVDELDAVSVVFIHPGRDRQNVRIEDDIVGIEADSVDQDVVGPPAYCHFVCLVRRLTINIVINHKYHASSPMAIVLMTCSSKSTMIDKSNSKNDCRQYYRKAKKPFFTISSYTEKRTNFTTGTWLANSKTNNKQHQDTTISKTLVCTLA